MSPFLRSGLLLLAALPLAACNSLTADSVATFRVLADGKLNHISPEQINNPEADTLFIAAGLAEGLYVAPAGSSGVVQWYGLTEQLETQYGRVTQLVGLETDVNAPLNQDDPFATGLLNLDNGTQVVRSVDLPLTYQTGLQQIATYYRGPLEQFASEPGQPYQRIDEHVRMPDLDFETTNYYWVDPATGKVRRSIQQPAPGMLTMDMLFSYQSAQGEQP